MTNATGSFALGRCTALLLALALGGPILGQLAGCTSTPENSEERATRAVKLYKQGVERFTAGDIDAGITLLEEAKKLQPDYTQLRYDLGRMLLRRGLRLDIQSIVAAQEAERLAADGRTQEAERKRLDARAYNQKAWQDLGGAKVELHFVEPRVVEDRPNLYYFLAQVYTSLNDFDMALKYLDHSMAVASDMGATPAVVDQEKLKQMREMLLQAAAKQEQDRNR